MKLKQTSKSYFVNSKKNFEAKKIDFYTVEKCFSFAHNMIWGDGHHRVKRSGGQQLRTKGEMFANTLQGKIAEYIVYQEFTQHGFSDIEEPDTNIHGEGTWDDTDLTYKELKINIKSAAFFSDLLLLETKDWDSDGNYIPNKKNDASQQYDYFILTRLKPDLKYLLKSKHLLFSNDVTIDQLKKLVFNEQWFYDVAGVCSLRSIKYVIKNKYILPQGALLNEKTSMDADNYYIQSGSLQNIDCLFNELKHL